MTARRRPKQDPSESERELLDAAEELLRELPFRDVTAQAVMSRTGLKRPAFYTHFRDRYDPVLRVVQTISDELFATADRWLEGDGPRTTSGLPSKVSSRSTNGTARCSGL